MSRKSTQRPPSSQKKKVLCDYARQQRRACDRRQNIVEYTGIIINSVAEYFTPEGKVDTGRSYRSSNHGENCQIAKLISKASCMSAAERSEGVPSVFFLTSVHDKFIYPNPTALDPGVFDHGHYKICWSSQDIKKLEIAVEKSSQEQAYIDWEMVSKACPPYLPVECLIQYRNVSGSFINKSPWTSEEEKHLIALASSHGEHEWWQVAAELQTNRTPIDCLRRYRQLQIATDAGRGLSDRSTAKLMNKMSKAADSAGGYWLEQEERMLFLSAIAFGVVPTAERSFSSSSIDSSALANSTKQQESHPQKPLNPEEQQQSLPAAGDTSAISAGDSANTVLLLAIETEKRERAEVEEEVDRSILKVDAAGSDCTMLVSVFAMFIPVGIVY